MKTICFSSKLFRLSIHRTSFWLALILCLAIASQALIAAPSHSRLNRGLLAWFPFNGNTEDESGNGLDATEFGAVLAPDRFGHGNQAYLFSGNAYMTISDPKGLLNFDARSDRYTINLWVKLESLANRQDFIINRLSLNNPPCAYDIYFDNTTGKFAADTWDGDQNVDLESLTTPIVDQWYMLTMVDVSGTLKFYINGHQEIAPSLEPGTPNQIPPGYGSTLNNEQGRTIGRFVGPFYSWYTYGYLDDIRIYGRALSPKEITHLYRFHGFPRNQHD